MPASYPASAGLKCGRQARTRRGGAAAPRRPAL